MNELYKTGNTNLIPQNNATIEQIEGIKKELETEYNNGKDEFEKVKTAYDEAAAKTGCYRFRSFTSLRKVSDSRKSARLV